MVNNSKIMSLTHVEIVILKCFTSLYPGAWMSSGLVDINRSFTGTYCLYRPGDDGGDSRLL